MFLMFLSVGAATAAPPTSTAELIRQLHARDAATREVAARELGSHRRDANIVVTALGAACSDAAWGVRTTAAFTLGHIGAKSAIPILTRHLSDRSASVRIGAGTTIARRSLKLALNLPSDSPAGRARMRGLAHCP